MPKEVRSKNSRFRSQSYRKEWEKENWAQGWLKVSSQGASKAFCQFCDKNILAGKSELMRHAKTAQHCQNAAQVLGSTSMEQYVTKSLGITSVGKHEENEKRMTLREALHFASLKKKIILEWCPPAGSSLHGVDEKRCGNCKVTDNRSLILSLDTAAVVFNKFCGQRSSMPPDHIRRPDQLYIWKSDESPPTTHKYKNAELDDFEENYFNATETYRSAQD
ncbi:unnamed protein product [Clavelina lepadiformis]|uniref:Fucosyltransferase N-terminal domain-containing protein n=1 Tax=Clavelina lepadiformis TaxID=159417 RepID=A0ABP0F8T6_CLALP